MSFMPWLRHLKVAKVVTFMACVSYHHRNKNTLEIVLSSCECRKREQLALGLGPAL